MTGWYEAHGYAVDVCCVAVRSGFEGAGAFIAITHFHDGDGFGRGQHVAVTGACVIAVAVRNECAIDWPRGIDIKAAGFAEQS